MKSFSHYQAKLAKKLTKTRYLHSVAVAEVALALAKVHGTPEGLTYLAGLLHDYAKDLPKNILMELAKKMEPPMDPITKVYPGLWHGPIGALLVKEELHLKEPRLLQAIKYHTLGHPEMNKIDKIVFLADMIEPERSFSGVEIIRKKAFINLDEAMLIAYEQSIRYLLDNKEMIHPIIIKTRNELITLPKIEGR